MRSKLIAVSGPGGYLAGEGLTMIGQVISHYRILAKIGAGGMGIVYLAEDLKLGRLVALKVLPAEVANDAERIRRFEQEAKAASALNHPNILTIYEIEQSDGVHFMASEYIKGENLRERQERLPLSLEETLNVIAQVATALAAAHKVGLVHGDIKPDNIMLGEDGHVKVIDFGLAKLNDKKLPALGSENPTWVAQGAPCLLKGTLAYASPEQLDVDEVDALSDVWGLGICSYEMLAGRPPFLKETLVATVAAILRDEPAPLGEHVPAELSDIVRRALQKNRDERYQTVEDFRRDIDTLRHNLGVAEGSKSRGRTRLQPTPVASKVRSYKRRLAVGLAVILAAAVASVVWYRYYEPRRLVAAGRESLKQRTGDSLNEAKKHFERAAYYNPRYAPAPAGLAVTYALMEEYQGIPTKETLPKAEYYAKKSLELDPLRAETHASLGFILTKMWRWEEAERAFKRSIELDPKYARARHWYCVYLRDVGRMDEALTQIKTARDLDPSDKLIRINVVISYLVNGEIDKAEREGEELLNLSPGFWGGRSWLGMTRLELGPQSKSDAISDLEAGVNHSQRSHTLLANLGYGLAALGETKRAHIILKELEELYEQQKATGQDIAKVYAGLGDKDKAFFWLEKDYEVRSGDLPFIMWHPAFKSLRGDARYDDLLRRMGIQPETDSREQIPKPLAFSNEPPDKSSGPAARPGSSGGAP